MTSTAITSQLTKMEINTATSGAKTITAITQANPAVYTSTAHGLAKGDVVTLAGIVGMVQLNGQSGVVADVNANSFTLYGQGVRDTTGYTAYTSGGTATPVTWSQIANIKSFTGLDGAASDIDVSNLQSTAKEYLMGLQDEGQFSLELDLDTTDPGQMAMLSARTAQARKSFKITLPNAATVTFNGFCKKISIGAGVDQSTKRSVDIKVTGPATWA